MNPDRHHPHRPPTPEQLAAFADGQLPAEEAARLEAWLADHPDEAAEVEAHRWVTSLYRDNPPPAPAPAAWDRTLAGVHTRLAAPRRGAGRSRWAFAMITGLAGAAALLGAMTLAWTLWPRPATEPDTVAIKKSPEQLELENDAPFEVVEAREVNIISMDAEDAHRIAVDQPLMSDFELLAPEDIQILKLEPHPEEGHMPRLQRGPEVPMIVVAAAMEDPEP